MGRTTGRLPPLEDHAIAKRVLVLLASIGAGHMRTAGAVELALQQLELQAEVKSVDLLDLTATAML
jgi:hypothetical protein